MMKKNLVLRKVMTVALALSVAISGLAFTTQTSNASTKVGTVKSVIVKTVGQNKLKVTWKKSGKVSSYRVYQAIGTSTKYKVVKTTKSKAYTTKALAKNKTYKFKVRPMYKGKAGKLSYSVTSRTANSKKKNVTKLVFRNYCKNMTTEKICGGGEEILFAVEMYAPDYITKSNNNTDKAVSRTIRWRSSNTKVLTVKAKSIDGKGTCIKVKKNGTAYIYAKAHNGITTKIKVTVKPKSKLTTDEIHQQIDLTGLAWVSHLPE